MVLTTLALVAATLAYPDDKIRMTVQRAVYSTKDAEGVTFTLQNVGGTTISSPMYWSVHDVSHAVPLVLPPWEWASFTWNKRDRHGKQVGPGSYKIQAGPIWIGDHWETHTLTVALTSTGGLAGSSWFPLKVGTRWSYVATDGEVQEFEVAEWPGDYPPVKGFPMLKGKPLAFSCVRYWGWPISRFSVLTGVGFEPLFKFDRPVGTTWNYNAFRTLGVGAIDVSVVTPAATFPECYRIDVLRNGLPGSLPVHLWFARGIGLVAYRMRTATSDKLFRLRSATIRGSYGRWYTIGQS